MLECDFVAPGSIFSADASAFGAVWFKLFGHEMLRGVAVTRHLGIGVVTAMAVSSFRLLDRLDQHTNSRLALKNWSTASNYVEPLVASSAGRAPSEGPTLIYFACMDGQGFGRQHEAYSIWQISFSAIQTHSTWQDVPIAVREGDVDKVRELIFPIEANIVVGLVGVKNTLGQHMKDDFRSPPRSVQVNLRQSGWPMLGFPRPLDSFKQISLSRVALTDAVYTAVGSPVTIAGRLRRQSWSAKIEYQVLDSGRNELTVPLALGELTYDPQKPDSFGFVPGRYCKPWQPPSS